MLFCLLIAVSAAKLVGRFDVDPSGLGFVVPFDRRLIMDVHIPRGEDRNAARGEMVTVEITRWPTPTRNPIGRVLQVLGPIDAPGVDTEVIIPKYGLVDAHSEAAVSEAHRLGPEVRERDLRGRTDFRSVTTVTIDGETARDFDDAITIENVSGGHYLLGVHIADVSHYVGDGTILDEEAYERATSVVLPGARDPHVPARAGHGPVQPQPGRRSARAILRNGRERPRPGRARGARLSRQSRMARRFWSGACRPRRCRVRPRRHAHP